MQSTADFIKLKGIKAKGYGSVAKFAMEDTDLSILSKAILGYFISYTGGGDSAFPSRDTILKHLLISKTAYYKHLKPLIDQGYISITQEKSAGAEFAHNVYTIEPWPNKFRDNMSTPAEYINGIEASGSGIICKAVMIDERLPITAKGLYVYFCAAIGEETSISKKQKEILEHLNISEGTYYKYYNQLIHLNYITAFQQHVNGRLGENEFYLNFYPNIEKSFDLHCETDENVHMEQEVNEAACEPARFSTYENDPQPTNSLLEKIACVGIDTKMIGYESLCHDFGQTTTDTILNIWLDALNTNNQYLTSDRLLATDVKERFRTLNQDHFEYVSLCYLEARKKNPIENLVSYIIKSLWNAPNTIDAYYEAKAANMLYKNKNKTSSPHDCDQTSSKLRAQSENLYL